MKNHNMFTAEEKLKFWEAVIAHRIRAQAESGGDPDSAVTVDFIDHCKEQDPDFEDLIPALSITYPVMRKYSREGALNRKPDALKRGALWFAAVLFFGIQVFLVVRDVYTGLLFSGIVNGLMGSVYFIGLWTNSRIRKTYRDIARSTGLSFRYGAGGIPGFLYDPFMEGVYNGFFVRVTFENKWTGRWSRGLAGFGQAQMTGISTIKIRLPSPLTGPVQDKICKWMERNTLKGDISFNKGSIGYKVIGALNRNEMKNDLLNALNGITEILF